MSIDAYGGRHVRARLRPGTDKATIQAELGKLYEGLRLVPLFDKGPVVMGPARVGGSRMRRPLRCFGLLRCNGG